MDSSHRSRPGLQPPSLLFPTHALIKGCYLTCGDSVAGEAGHAHTYFGCLLLTLRSDSCGLYTKNNTKKDCQSPTQEYACLAKAQKASGLEKSLFASCLTADKTKVVR